MSNIQIKTIAIAAFKVSTTVLLFLSKVIVYSAIALAVVGELLFKEYAQSLPIEESSPIADPWDLESVSKADPITLESLPTPDLEPVSKADPITQAMPKALAKPSAKEIARPAVLSVELPDAVKEAMTSGRSETNALDVDHDRYQTLTSPQLRKECSAIGIVWRNAHGKSKHMSKAEMLAALVA